MNTFLPKVFFCVGIAWAATVIRREVGTHSEARSSLEVEGGDASDLSLQEGSSERKKSSKNDLDEAYEDKDIDMCDDDYPLGKPNSTECAEPAWHHIIWQQNMCREAAAEANVSIHELSFMVPPGYQKNRPLGCFAMACDHDPNGMCYYFSRYDGVPDNITGTPVCVRYKFRNGTLDASAPDGVSCPGGYHHIDEEMACKEASTCLGAALGAPFEIVKEEREHYAAGCFLHRDIGAFYFNPVVDENGTKWAAPKSPAGTPLCNVSNVTHWPS